MEAFSHIGGTSITLQRMRYKVEDTFGQKVALEVLQQHSSIAALATWLQRDTSLSRSPSTFNTATVVYNEKGSMPPLFFVAPVSGVSLCYKKLASMLGAGQPVVALSHTCLPRRRASHLGRYCCRPCWSRFRASGYASRGTQGPIFTWWLVYGGRPSHGNVAPIASQGKSATSVILIDSPAPLEGIGTVLKNEAALLAQLLPIL